MVFSIQVFVNGVVSGLGIAGIALAFSFVYLPTRVFYVALGGIYTATPFIAWACLRAGLPWYATCVVAMAVAVTLSLICELINHWPLQRKGASSSAHFVTSLGLYLVITQGCAMVWGEQTKSLRAGLDTVVSVGNVVVTGTQVVTIVTFLCAFSFVFAWLKLTTHGLLFRALADNPRELALRGYSVRKLRLCAFGLAGAFCAISSLLTGYDIGFNPNGGLRALLLGVVACIIGGSRSFAGPILGGILLGVVRAAAVWNLSAKWEEAVTFAILVMFLLVRPAGLLGGRERLEATE